MADDVLQQINAAGDTALFRAKEIGGKKHPGVIPYDPQTGVEIKAASQADVAALETKLTTLVDSIAALVLQLSGSAAYAPGYDRQDQGGGPQATDPAGNLLTRSTALTDEGTFRVNYANTSLAVAIGSATFTNGEVGVVCNLAATTDVHAGDYIKLDADAESTWAQIESIDSPTQITLVAAYTGSSAAGAASRALVKPFTGSGGAIAVASGQVTITSGTNNGTASGVIRAVDYAPLVFRDRVSISARNANQTIYAGLREEAATPRWFARFEFDGVTNTAVRCATGRNPTTAPSASEQETTTVTLPFGLTSAQMMDLRVELLTESVRFYIAGIRVAEHTKVIPSQHDDMAAVTEVINGTGAATTIVTGDYMTGKNHNKLEVGIMSDGEQVVAVNAPCTDQTYTFTGVIALNTDLLFIDCSQIRAISVQCVAMGTTGVVTPQFSNDGGTTWNGGQIVPAGGGAVATTFNAAGLWIIPVCGRICRLRLTTATTALTTTLRVSGLQQSPVIIPTSLTVTAANLQVNQNQVVGTTPITASPQGATNKATAVVVEGSVNNTDYSAQAWAAASGSGATIAPADGTGAAVGFDISVTAWTAGASTGLVVSLQESYDNGTTWNTIWMTEPITAVSHTKIPAIPVGGRRRMSWVNLSGAATTATVTVVAMASSVAFVKQAQYFDRTASVTSGTAALGNGAAYDIAGLKTMTFAILAGTASAAASFKVQMSQDGTNWYDASAAQALTASALTVIPLTSGMVGRFARFVCTVAGTSQVVTYGSIYGTN